MGRKNCWWLEKKVFYPPHLTLDKINATRDIDLSGVTKGFEKGLKIKVCLAKVLDLSRKGATCSTHEIYPCFTRDVLIPELQNLLRFIGSKILPCFLKDSALTS